jgi:FkbM family methyltransferase
MSAVRNMLKATLPPKMMDAALRLNWEWLMSYGRWSYSQEGEDLLLSKIFIGALGKTKGFYVDIGAHHPVSASNTHLLYRRGWRGINIDPLPGTERLFKRRRPRDITLELGISDQAGVLSFFMFDSAAHNTFSEKHRDFAIWHGENLIRTIPVTVERLDTVLSRHLPEGTAIDFMNIDVEGGEDQVLASNDWTRFRPSVICLEMIFVRAEEVTSHPTGRYLADRGYRFLAKLDNSVFFQEKDFCCTDRDFRDRQEPPPKPGRGP